MKCHYEVLGLQRNADDAEIKQAYRKMALKWHPDKNLNNPDGAKEQFQAVQQAYEVLSDVHERSWYDNHREQILRGGHTEYEDDSLDVFQYFTVSCYKGHGDDAGGFFAVYREVFRKIATEDIEYIAEGEFEKIPEFGNSKSNYEEVVGPFYAYWQSYSTKKSYAWLSPHNIAEIRDRRVLKVIEKESKKIQQKARKERNEAVRNLVSFVKKRDKRMQAYKKYLEERSLQNRAKYEQVRLEQIRKRRQEIEEQCKNNTVDDEYELKLKQLENAYASDNTGDEEESDDDEDDDEGADKSNEEDVDDEELGEENVLYCVACNKTFKTYSARENHDLSKKHKENVDKLIKKMKLEDVNYKETEKKHDEALSPIESDADLVLSEDEDKPKVSKKSNKNKNKFKTIPIPHDDDEKKVVADEEPVLTRVSESDNNWAETSSNKKNKKSKSKPVKQQNKSKESDEDKSTDLPPQQQTEKPNPKLKKSVPPPKNDTDELGDELDVDHNCVTCHATFESKNKLFAHLKKTNHGVYIPKVTLRLVDEGEKKSNGKKNKKK